MDFVVFIAIVLIYITFVTIHIFAGLFLWRIQGVSVSAMLSVVAYIFGGAVAIIIEDAALGKTIAIIVCIDIVFRAGVHVCRRIRQNGSER
ncbi:hypothetical protein [Thioalkalivibrio sp. HK1]|uniref:hypothetical protein n=1 Tax=Thioalkalivibrio sp. HK1 TaxID=1469245 RepID=UPI00046E62AF|nr:hypothetical protein [Thioalkalivibrio sp. HK1]